MEAIPMERGILVGLLHCYIIKSMIPACHFREPCDQYRCMQRSACMSGQFDQRLCNSLLKIVQLLKAYRIKFQKFAAHAHKDALINETFIPT